MNGLAKRFLLITALVVLSAVPAFALPWDPQSGNCLSQYNANLIDCDNYFCPRGMWSCLGCKSDALADYYACVYNSITQ